MSEFPYTFFVEATGEILSSGRTNAANARPREGRVEGMDGVAIIHEASDPDLDCVENLRVVRKPAAVLEAQTAVAEMGAMRQARFMALSHQVDVVNGPRWQEMPVADRAALRALRHALLDMPETGGVLPEKPAVTPLERAKRNATGRMLAALDTAAEALVGDVPQAEMLSWASKERAARAVRAGTETAEDMAILSAEAAVTGDTIPELTDRIITRADAYRAASGQLAGLRRVVTAAIAAATTEQDVADALRPLADI